MGKQIIEGNKLIAEFMGWTQTNDGQDEFYFNGVDKYCLPENFKYHSSIELLMPVVEKIESIKDKQGYRWRVDIYLESCSIYNTHNLGDAQFVTNSITKIQAIWLTVIDFIEAWVKY